MLTAYSTTIFLAITLGGLVALRRQPNVAVRGVIFMLLCFACFKATFWLAARWDLDPVDLGIAWAVALLVVAVVEATTRVLRSKRVTGTS